MRQQIPNALTLANLFCGCCAVVLWLDGQPYFAAAFMAASFVLDYADGLVARALGVHSPMGRELDSLADVVSFGVVPGLMLYSLLVEALCPDNLWLWCWAAAPGFVLTTFAAYRLGRFNLDTTPRSYFIGLSTPACTVFVLGMALAAHDNAFGLGEFLRQNPWVTYGLVAVLSYLMVSHIPMHGLKVSGAGPAGWGRIAGFALVGGLLLWGLGPLGMSVVVVLYIVYSLLVSPVRE
ncbi:MAG: CDP-alcohol phosphatidyltransferase family protein [Saprospiraceae bacterium]|nr:CDP-alcohol phosphatidyltransferase family protein [Saprospiraceae bacterium]MDW8228640.1 CDP-alcohol phosphatidyltransferase family protein [Saprospiraceae bacterium]